VDVIRVIKGAPSAARVRDEINRHYNTLVSPDRSRVIVVVFVLMNGSACPAGELGITTSQDHQTGGHSVAEAYLVVGWLVGNR
jgi:hypothetical protein